VIGYGMKKLDIPLAPMVLTLVLTPMMESTLRQSLEMSAGDPLIFTERPLALTLLGLAALVLVLSSLRLMRSVRTDSEV
jgi:putative tricarboxylic transport membrane protein